MAGHNGAESMKSGFMTWMVSGLFRITWILRPVNTRWKNCWDYEKAKAITGRPTVSPMRVLPAKIVDDKKGDGARDL